MRTYNPNNTRSRFSFFSRFGSAYILGVLTALFFTAYPALPAIAAQTVQTVQQDQYHSGLETDFEKQYNVDLIGNFNSSDMREIKYAFKTLEEKIPDAIKDLELVIVNKLPRLDNIFYVFRMPPVINSYPNIKVELSKIDQPKKKWFDDTPFYTYEIDVNDILGIKPPIERESQDYLEYLRIMFDRVEEKDSFDILSVAIKNRNQIPLYVGGRALDGILLNGICGLLTHEFWEEGKELREKFEEFYELKEEFDKYSKLKEEFEGDEGLIKKLEDLSDQIKNFGGRTKEQFWYPTRWPRALEHTKKTDIDDPQGYEKMYRPSLTRTHVPDRTTAAKIFKQAIIEEDMRETLAALLINLRLSEYQQESPIINEKMDAATKFLRDISPYFDNLYQEEQAITSKK